MEKDQKSLINLHNLTIVLNTVSIIALFLLSINFLLGISSLIVITIINNFLAEKRKDLGTSLPNDIIKKLFKRQVFANLFILLIVLPLLLFPFPPSTPDIMIIFLIAGFTLIMCTVSYVEYRQGRSNY